MKIGTALTRTAAVTAVALAVTTFAASPAAAGDPVRRQCSGYGGEAAGVTTRNEGVTYVVWGGCGTRMGVRVRYNHVGGTSWTSWKYADPRQTTRVLRSVYPNNATAAEHFAGGTGNFFSNY